MTKTTTTITTTITTTLMGFDTIEINLVSSVVSLVQLVSPSVAHLAKLVSISVAINYPSEW